jgi:hypothetical protein
VSNVIQFPQNRTAVETLKAVLEDIEASGMDPTRIVILLEYQRGSVAQSRMAVGGTDSHKDVLWMLKLAMEQVMDNSREE